MSRGRLPEPLDFFIWTVQVLRLLSFFVLSFSFNGILGLMNTSSLDVEMHD